MVTLQNISRVALTILLTHPSFVEPTAEGDPHAHRPIKRVTVEHTKSGKLTARVRTILMPTSITLLAGEKRSGLPNAVVECRDVRAAVAKKAVRVLSQTVDEPAPPSEPKKDETPPEPAGLQIEPAPPKKKGSVAAGPPSLPKHDEIKDAGASR